jgi:hypothetical protein
MRIFYHIDLLQLDIYKICNAIQHNNKIHQFRIVNISTNKRLIYMRIIAANAA